MRGPFSYGVTVTRSPSASSGSCVDMDRGLPPPGRINEAPPRLLVLVTQGGQVGDAEFAAASPGTMWGTRRRSSTLVSDGLFHAFGSFTAVAHSGAMVMYYGGDLIEVALAAALALRRYSAAGHAPVHSPAPHPEEHLPPAVICRPGRYLGTEPAVTA
jgi:hypothetical protein